MTDQFRLILLIAASLMIGLMYAVYQSESKVASYRPDLMCLERMCR